MKINCFKAYDVRGRLPDELNEDITYLIGRAYAAFVKPEKVAVGRDIRLTSPAICDALVRGLNDSGVDVLDIGMCGTEEVYFATFHAGLDGGIMVTASHNPKDYNGLKFVREGSRPISADTGLKEIRALAEAGKFEAPQKRGACAALSIRDDYVSHLLQYIDRTRLKPLKLVTNAGNGGAGLVIDALQSHLPFEYVKVNHEPDGDFPNGIPNPMLEENRATTTDAVIRNGADFGIAWDGDFDRCFLFDESGLFIEGYYIVGLLAKAFLAKHPGSKIIYDPRVTWNTIEVVNQAGGIPVQSKSGHAFIKDAMRKEDAIYGGEMSAHHYFRDFSYCDSGMIPWLLVAEMVSRTGQPLSSMVDEMMAAFPSSGEINRRVQDPGAIFATLEDKYGPESRAIDFTDGLGMEFDLWRFNIRSSNTESVVRLNVEARHDKKLLDEKTAEILSLLEAGSA